MTAQESFIAITDLKCLPELLGKLVGGDDSVPPPRETHYEDLVDPMGKGTMWASSPTLFQQCLTLS